MLEDALAHADEEYNEYGAMCFRQRPYAAPCRMSLQDGLEWRLIMCLTGTGSYGETYDKEHENDSGGYEDDVICIRPYDWGFEEEPEGASRPEPPVQALRLQHGVVQVSLEGGGHVREPERR